MLKRREFIKSSVVLATAASAGALAANATGQDRQQTADRIHFVLIDEELEDSVAFANVLIAQGARSYSLQQDIGRLWFGELGEAYARGHAIAGLTSHSELLICAEFARQRGAKVRFEGAHDCRGGEVLSHSLRIGTDDAAISSVLAAADRHWPQALASRLTGLSRCDSLRDDSCRTSTRRSATHPGSLFSWVIA